MQIEQYVMAYKIEQDRIRALLPDSCESLRPVLRINAEIEDENSATLEFNTAVKCKDFKGWLNIGRWQNVTFRKDGRRTVFSLPFLEIEFTAVGVKGSCPAEKDNDGCVFLKENKVRKAEQILSEKEFCDCAFAWHFSDNDAKGESIGKTLPAISEESKTQYERAELSPENTASIPCEQVLGSYKVSFDRKCLYND